MNRLFLGNFDFEHQLAEPARKEQTPFLRRFNSELAGIFAAVAAPGDALWTPNPLDDAWAARLRQAGLPAVECVSDQAPKLLRGRQLCPWGWSADMLEWGRRSGLVCACPSLEGVRRVNCRLFAHDLETEWGVGLPGARVIRAADDLEPALRVAHALAGTTAAQRWVLKSRFGMSGRERLLGRGMEVPAATLGWLRKRLQRDGAVLFEPWVERIAEAGLQFEIPPAQSDPPLLVGVTPLLSDAAGGYRGSRITHDTLAEPAEWSAAVAWGLRAAERARQAGYFGPLGIDAMRYRDAAGGEQLRPLQDFNARYTMGRISLGWRRILPAGWRGSWLHPVASGGPLADRLAGWESRLPAGVQLIATSPDTAGGLPVQHASVLLLAPTSASLQEAEQVVLGSA